MRLVVIESPFAGEIQRNLEYVRRCMADCLARGEAPYASHALYTQPGVLRDEIPAERTLGIEAGFAWWRVADAIIFYEDYGYSRGMEASFAKATSECRAFETRRIGKNPSTP
jgi:hypothetical protein